MKIKGLLYKPLTQLVWSSLLALYCAWVSYGQWHKNRPTAVTFALLTIGNSCIAYVALRRRRRELKGKG